MVTDVDVDVVGLGFGPANIALAIALEELSPQLSACFAERQARPGWQAGMMLDGSDIQHHPVRDLVTPRNPRSRYTFLNYLVEHDRLFEFLNLGLPFPLRKDYARYIVWAAEQVGAHVWYSTTVRAVHATEAPQEAGRPGRRPGVRVELAGGGVITARAAVVAPGRAPLIPPVFRGLDDERVFHFTSYLDRVPDLARARRIAILGASQSAAELVLDAWTRLPGVQIVNVLREFGYRQKDLSPFTNEVYYPSFVDYYYGAPEPAQRELDRQLRYTNYSAADSDVIQALYARLYEQRLDGGDRVTLARNVEVMAATADGEGVHLALADRAHRGTSLLTVDAVVLATGFHDLTDERGEQFLPAVLDPLQPLVARTPSGRAVIGRDYRIIGAEPDRLPPLYLNGLCETTHGMGDAGSFSLLSIRAATMARSLAAALADRPVDAQVPA
jgi:L-ornithine N5-oxygenase